MKTINQLQKKLKVFEIEGSVTVMADLLTLAGFESVMHKHELIQNLKDHYNKQLKGLLQDHPLVKQIDLEDLISEIKNEKSL